MRRKMRKKVRNAQKEEGEASKSGQVKKAKPEAGAPKISPETKPIRRSRTSPPSSITLKSSTTGMSATAIQAA